MIQGWDTQVPEDPERVACPACPFGLVGTRNNHLNPHHLGEANLNPDGWCWQSRRPVLESSRVPA